MILICGTLKFKGKKKGGGEDEYGVMRKIEKKEVAKDENKKQIILCKFEKLYIDYMAFELV